VRRPKRSVQAWRVDAGDASVVVIGAPIETPALEALSAAERDVVERALAGASNVEIARARGCAVRTVANLLARSYRKLGVSSRRELAAKLAPAE
jgi:DNA-binding CsgD family transcriptional regulator